MEQILKHMEKSSVKRVKCKKPHSVTCSFFEQGFCLMQRACVWQQFLVNRELLKRAVIGLSKVSQVKIK
jgi:hypothetical protein